MKQFVILFLHLIFTFFSLVFGQEVNHEQEYSEKAALYFKNDSLQQLVDKLKTENALIKVQKDELNELLELQNASLKQKRNSSDKNEQIADSSLLKIKYELPVDSRKIIVPLKLDGIEITHEGKLAYQLVVDQDGRVVYVSYDANKSTILRDELSIIIEQRIKLTLRYEKKNGPVEKIAFMVNVRMK